MAMYGMSRSEKRALARVMKGQTQSKWNYYYSRVRITTTSVTTTTGVIVVNSGKSVRAFSYGIGQDMSPAIGATGTTAQLSDTNILTANQTVSGESLLVMGVGIILLPTSEPLLAMWADPNISVQIILNGTTKYPLGIPSMVPGPGGLMGQGISQVAAPVAEAAFTTVGPMSNGWPAAQNFFRLPEPIVWMAAGQGDAAFNVLFTVENTITTPAVFGGTAPAGNRTGSTADTAGAPYYVQGFTASTTGAVFVDYMVVLIGRTFNPLSTN